MMMSDWVATYDAVAAQTEAWTGKCRMASS